MCLTAFIDCNTPAVSPSIVFTLQLLELNQSIKDGDGEPAVFYEAPQDKTADLGSHAEVCMVM